MRSEWRLRLGRWLGSPWGLRCSALAAAVIVWYGVEWMTGHEVPVSGIPLTVVVPPGWTVTETDATHVTATFRGTRDDTHYLDREFVRATLDLNGRESEGAMELELGFRNITAPGGARVVQVDPPRVRVKLEREETRQIPVALATRNSLPEGYKLRAPTITPASVEVTGPASVVGSLQSVKTAELELDGRVTPVKGRRMALATGGAMAGLRIAPAEVVVDMDVAEDAGERVFEHLPVRALVPAGPEGGAKIEISPGTATVTVRGRPDALKKVGADDFQVFVDASAGGTAGGKARRPVLVRCAAGVAVTGVEPATATVEASPVHAPGAGGGE